MARGLKGASPRDGYASRTAWAPLDSTCARPDHLSAGAVAVHLIGNADDENRKFNRTENVRPIPPPRISGLSLGDAATPSRSAWPSTTPSGSAEATRSANSAGRSPVGLRPRRQQSWRTSPQALQRRRAARRRGLKASEPPRMGGFDASATGWSGESRAELGESGPAFNVQPSRTMHLATGSVRSASFRATSRSGPAPVGYPIADLRTRRSAFSTSAAKYERREPRSLGWVTVVVLPALAHSGAPYGW